MVDKGYTLSSSSKFQNISPEVAKKSTSFLMELWIEAIYRSSKSEMFYQNLQESTFFVMMWWNEGVEVCSNPQRMLPC